VPLKTPFRWIDRGDIQAICPYCQKPVKVGQSVVAFKSNGRLVIYHVPCREAWEEEEV